MVVAYSALDVSAATAGLIHKELKQNVMFINFVTVTGKRRNMFSLL